MSTSFALSSSSPSPFIENVIRTPSGTGRGRSPRRTGSACEARCRPAHTRGRRPRSVGREAIPTPAARARNARAGGWRRDRDSNPRYRCRYTRFPSAPVRPLRHPSVFSSSEDDVDAQPKARAARALSAGGGVGIRTLGSLAATPVFETGTFDHSVTPPRRDGIRTPSRRNAPRRGPQSPPSHTSLWKSAESTSQPGGHRGRIVGLRTLGSLAATPVFETGTFDHSVTPPRVRSCERRHPSRRDSRSPAGADATFSRSPPRAPRTERAVGPPRRAIALSIRP